MRIGFVGLGTQGKPIARNIASAGHDLTVYDIRPEVVAELVSAGAKSAADLDDLGRRCDAIIVCVVDDAQVEQVLLSSTGLFEVLAPGSIVIVHSTIHPDTVKKIDVVAKSRDIRLLDAPVSGGERGAVNKAMSYMVGGDADVIALCEPILRASGDRITHVGPVGSAAAAKLVHQVVLCGNMMAIAEGTLLGEAAGLDRATIRQIVSEGWAQSKIAEIWGDPVAAATEAIFYKDLRLALALARERGALLPATALCQQRLGDVLPL